MVIEQFIIQYLLGKLSQEGIGVYPTVPESNPNPADDPAKFLIVQKTGSSLRNHLWTANIAIQSYAGSIMEASYLDQKAINAMLGMISEPEICRVELNSDYEYTDTDTKQPRYQAVFVVTHYSLG